MVDEARASAMDGEGGTGLPARLWSELLGSKDGADGEAAAHAEAAAYAEAITAGFAESFPAPAGYGIIGSDVLTVRRG